MTGNAEITTNTRQGLLSQLRQRPCHYFAIDGGSGAHLLAALSERHPYARQVASPRHADRLLLIEPISHKLSSAVTELAKAQPHPARILIVGESSVGHDAVPATEYIPLEDLFPGARRVIPTSVEALVRAILDVDQSTELANIERPGIDETTIQLPQKHEQEMATELLVLSQGPVQSFTAGPLRLLLVCDGEQVLSAQVEAGYAYRGIAQAMLQANWQQALSFARRLDPLAPLAGQLAYVSVIEELQGWQPPQQVVRLREAALALERVENALWWLVRFAHVVADPALAARSYRLTTRFADILARCWQVQPYAWVLPGYSMSAPAVMGSSTNIAHLRQIAGELEIMQRQLERNRLLALRTRGIGVLSSERLAAAGSSGTVLTASKHGAGDIQSRLSARLDAATGDLRLAVEALAAMESAPTQPARWDVSAGMAHVTVAGPRGDIGLCLESSGGEQPTGVSWQCPSPKLLPLLPELLAGQKLADAEVIVASLDLAMAEADG